MIVRTLLGMLVLSFVAVAIEGYVILSRVDSLAHWNRQLLGVASDLLAAIPGKSAPPTDAHTEELADLREEVTAAMLDHAERLDALEDPPADTEPVRTVEAQAAIDQWHQTIRRPVPYRRGDR